MARFTMWYNVSRYFPYIPFVSIFFILTALLFPSTVIASSIVVPPILASTIRVDLQQEEPIYVVQRGDTLTAIANRFGLSISELMRINGLTNPNFVFVGQRLIVTEKETTDITDDQESIDESQAPDEDPDVDASITPTNTMPSTGALTDTPDLTVTASLTDTTVVTDIIRGTNTLSATTELSGTEERPESAQAVEDALSEPSTITYVVQPGDSLSVIAYRFDTTTAELMRINFLGNANFVFVGQILLIPVPVVEEGDPEIATDKILKEATRINFETNATSTTVDGSITFPERLCYILEAVAGQEMTVAITSAGNLANFSVQAVDLAVNAGVPLKRLENEERRWRSLLPISGDYLLCVGVPAGTIDYQLRVTIPVLCTSVTQEIQTIDWDAFLRADPALEHETVQGDHYVTVLASTSEQSLFDVEGIPQIDQIAYGDFDGDCVEEAGVPLFSGGTAGNLAYLVYDLEEDADETTPVLIAWGTGYKLLLAADAGTLVVSNALYNGWEPNCCPSGRSYDRYRLVEEELTLVAAASEGFTEARAATILQFYNLLTDKQYSDAYALLSPTFQAVNPFESWEGGYANTGRILAAITPDPSVEDRLSVELEVSETLSSGTTRLRYFRGYWDVVWDGDVPGWMLRDGRFVVVP